jgi:hypothetical protein
MAWLRVPRQVLGSHPRPVPIVNVTQRPQSPASGTPHQQLHMVMRVAHEPGVAVRDRHRISRSGGQWARPMGGKTGCC